MKWLNIEVAILRSPKFIGAEPIERATWLSLLGYCADQENGGRIQKCSTWKDRTWQQTCGVTAAEVALKSTLWHWEDVDLLVEFYPIDKEKELKAKRLAGAKGGVASGKTRRSHSEVSSEPEAVVEAVLEGDLERKGKGKGKGNGNGMLFPMEKEAKKSRKKMALSDDQYVSELAQDPAYQGIDVKKEFLKFSRWCVANRRQPTRRFLVNWLNNADRYMAPAATLPESKAETPKRLSVWEIKEKRAAVTKKIEKIRSDPSNKYLDPEGFGMKLKASPAAEIEILKKRLKELDEQLEN